MQNITIPSFKLNEHEAKAFVCQIKTAPENDFCFARCVSAALWPLVTATDAARALGRLSDYEQAKEGILLASWASAEEVDDIEVNATWNKEDECLSICAWRDGGDAGMLVMAGAQWLKRERCLIFSCGADMARRYDIIHKCAGLAVSCDAEAHFEIYEESECSF